MNLSSNRAVLLLASAIGLALGVGFLAGITWGSYRSHAADQAVRLAFAAERATLLYANASPDEAIGELSRHLVMLDELNSGETTHLTVEKALTLVRLSALAAELGNDAQSQDFMVKAKELCERSGWRDCSEEAVARLATR